MQPRHVQLIQDGRVDTSGWFGRGFHYASDAELVAIVERLIGMGYAFVHQPHGWPPAAVLQGLQERGLLTLPFIAITWTGPGQWRTFRVPADDAGQ